MLVHLYSLISSNEIKDVAVMDMQGCVNSSKLVCCQHHADSIPVLPVTRLLSTSVRRGMAVLMSVIHILLFLYSEISGLGMQ